MSDFRQHFLAESIANLADLQFVLAGDFDENRRLEAFRIIHTVKGGAQLFGLKQAARIADDLENLLSKGERFTGRELLLEGIGLLEDNLRESDADSPADILEKLRRAGRASDQSGVLLTNIPPQIFKNFSPPEQNATIAALRAGKTIYCAEVGFKAAAFTDEYRKLRRLLGEKSEIIATLPSEKYNAAGRLGFRIFLASREPLERLRDSVRDFTIEISSHACAENNAPGLFTMLSEIAAHAEDIARKSGKEIRVTILSSDVKLSAALTKMFFDIFLHLVRNAVDHAIEREGNLEIRLFDEGPAFYLSVADDGCGLDPEKLRRRALEKNLIAGDDAFTEQKALELIFAPGFSTAERVTEISGRGVGLDAVKNAVEKLNGKISVRNRKTNGAIFEIIVPREEI